MQSASRAIVLKRMPHDFSEAKSALGQLIHMGNVRQQAITGTNVDQFPWRHQVASDLIPSWDQISNDILRYY